MAKVENKLRITEFAHKNQKVAAQEEGQQAVKVTLRQCRVEVQKEEAQCDKGAREKARERYGKMEGREEAKELHKKIECEKAKDRY